MKITIPEGYTLPEGTKDGDTFEELVTFKVEGDKLIPQMIAGVEIPYEEPKTESEDMSEDTSEGEGSTEEVSAKGPKNPMKGMGARIMGMA